MASAGMSEITKGFYVGLGVALAFAIFTALQMLVGRVVHKDG
jgi:hypothetical protein